jgi:hypothetical protein
MKRQFSALSIFVLALGALATQSCEYTDGQNSYYNRGHYGYYRDGGYVQDNGYYPNGRYAQDNGYYNEGRFIGDGYQSNRPTINLHF